MPVEKLQQELAAYAGITGFASGTGSVSGDDLAENCNGGSQSGVYPNCGTFGATIRVAYNCQTTEFTPQYGTSCRETCITRA